MSNLLEVRDLTKRYAGNEGLRGVTMTIPPRQIVGLLGPNGSGKTTLLKTIAGLLNPDSGEIIYPGGKKRGIESKQTVSFLPDSSSYPAWMKVGDVFTFYREMYPDYSEERAKYMKDLLELSSGTLLKKMSKGMQERVSLAAAFSRDTSLYLLDEPLGGIDPLSRMKVLDTILSMELDESAILLSTHLVKDVETIFDSFVFISDGQVIDQGDCEELRVKSGITVEQHYLEVFGYAKTI